MEPPDPRPAEIGHNRRAMIVSRQCTPVNLSHCDRCIAAAFEGPGRGWLVALAADVAAMAWLGAGFAAEKNWLGVVLAGLAVCWFAAVLSGWHHSAARSRRRAEEGTRCSS